MKDTKNIHSSLLCNIQNDWGFTQLLFNRYWQHFDLGVSGLSMKLTNSVPTAQLRNEWCYTTTPLISLHGVYRGQNFTFLLFFHTYDLTACHFHCSHTKQCVMDDSSIIISVLHIYQRIKMYKH